jgi:hypothetical protein
VSLASHLSLHIMHIKVHSTHSEDTLHHELTLASFLTLLQSLKVSLSSLVPLPSLATPSRSALIDPFELSTYRSKGSNLTAMRL